MMTMRRLMSLFCCGVLVNSGKMPYGQQKYQPQATKCRIWHIVARIRGENMSKHARPKSYSDVQAAVGRRIQWARELVEPNRAEFARVMGVHISTLGKIEDGTRAPSIFNILEICHRLRVSADYILCGSLRGVDGELAAVLVTRHPELINDSYTAKGYGT